MINKKYYILILSSLIPLLSLAVLKSSNYTSKPNSSSTNLISGKLKLNITCDVKPTNHSIMQGFDQNIKKINDNTFILYANGPATVTISSANKVVSNGKWDNEKLGHNLKTLNISGDNYSFYTWIVNGLQFTDAIKQNNPILPNDFENGFGHDNNNAKLNFISSSQKNLILRQQINKIFNIENYNLYVDVQKNTNNITNNQTSDSINLNFKSLMSINDLNPGNKDWSYSYGDLIDFSKIQLIDRHTNFDLFEKNSPTENTNYLLTSDISHLNKTGKTKLFNEYDLYLPIKLKENKVSGEMQNIVKIYFSYGLPGSNMVTKPNTKYSWSDKTKNIIGGICALVFSLLLIFISSKVITRRKRNSRNANSQFTK